MYISDPIGDFLTRLRNAKVRGKETVETPASKMLVAIANILKQEGFLTDVQVIEAKPQSTLQVNLAYQGGEPVIRELRRSSKPGIRRYMRADELKPVRRGQGIAILSTSKGLLTNNQAFKAGIGGEYICEIW